MIEYVKVQLLELAFSEFQRSSELNKLARPAAFRKVAHVFHKRVPWHCQLPVQQNRGFACQIVRVVLRGAVQRRAFPPPSTWKTTGATTLSASPDRIRRRIRRSRRSGN